MWDFLVVFATAPFVILGLAIIAGAWVLVLFWAWMAFCFIRERITLYLSAKREG